MEEVRPRAECIRAAGEHLARARARRDSLSPREAAQIAYQPGGPSPLDIENRIRAMRGMRQVRRAS